MIKKLIIPIVTIVVFAHAAGFAEPGKIVTKGDFLRLKSESNDGILEDSDDVDREKAPQNLTYKEMPKDLLLKEGVDLQGIGCFLLFETAYDVANSGDRGVRNAADNLRGVVEYGGAVITDGRNSAIPAILGGAAAPQFYRERASSARPVGLSGEIDITIVDPRIIERMGGLSKITLTGDAPPAEQSIVLSAGENSQVFATARYLFEDYVPGPFGPYTDYRFVETVNALSFPCGSDRGRVIYMNTGILENFSAGGLRRMFVDAVVDLGMFASESFEEIEDAFFEWYRSADEDHLRDLASQRGVLVVELMGLEDFNPFKAMTTPPAIGEMNVNMVVFGGGIGVAADHIGRDAVYAFVLTETRRSWSLAPEIDEGDPELIVGLYDPKGGLFSTRSLSGDKRSILVHVPAENNIYEGEWKFVIKRARGYDGSRVVLAACLPGVLDNGSAYSGPKFPKPDAPKTETSGSVRHELGQGMKRLKGENVSFGPMIQPRFVSVWRVDDDLELDMEGTRDRIVMEGWFAKKSGGNAAFCDGTVWNEADLREQAVAREPEIVYTPVVPDGFIGGSDGDDLLIGTERNEMFFGGPGDDTIDGGGGSNVFYYRKGEGHDTITATRGKGRINALRFDRDISSGDLSASWSGDDLRIEVAGGSVTISGWCAEGMPRGIDRIEFSGGEIWDARDMEKLAFGDLPGRRRIYFSK